MPRQPDDAHIMAVIFAAKLRTDPKVASDLQDFGFPFGVAPGMAKFVALRRQAVKRPDRGLLDRFQRYRRRAANHHREVIGGYAEVPRSSIAVRINSRSDCGFNTALVFCRRKVLLAEPPPFWTKANLYYPFPA